MKININNKFKFLFVSSDKFPPFRVDVAVLFGKEIIQRGHQIDWILQSYRNNKKNFITQWSGSRVFVGATDNRTTRFHRFLKKSLDFLHDLRIIKLSKKELYDFIQVKDKFITALIAIAASKFSKCKFFFWLSYPYPEADIYNYTTGTARYPYIYLIRGNILKFLLYNIILPLADHIFVQSEQMKKDIVSKGFSANKITPVPMGVNLDASFFANPIPNNSEKKDSYSIIYLGTMDKIRRIDFVLRVFEKVLDKIPEAKLYMVGGSDDPHDLEFLKKEAIRLKVEQAVTFTGNLNRSEALKFVENATVCISPFFPTPILNSTSPTKLVEYMAMGKPVVANVHPEQQLVIEQSKAGFCVSYDEDAFAKAITTLLLNPEIARKMGERGRRYVEKNRSYKKIADLIEKQYNKII